MSRSNYQTVLITGGAGGLGKQMARQWAKARRYHCAVGP